MTVYSMLTSGRSGIASQAICFCVARGKPAENEINAIRSLLDAPNSGELIANRPLHAFARAALHVLQVEKYTGNNSDVLDAITMFSNQKNLDSMRSCSEYRSVCEN